MKTHILVLAMSFQIIAFGAAHGVEQKKTPRDEFKNAYQGQENRNIKSLSEKDIEALQRGSGWGLAKAAELNGVPGPAHVLALKKQLHLSDEQIDQIQKIWQEMHTAAKIQGLVYIDTEKEIEQFFKQDKSDRKHLNELLKNSALSLAKLKEIHLVAHLQTKPLLTQHQITMYDKLRGYGQGAHHHNQRSKGHHSGHH